MQQLSQSLWINGLLNKPAICTAWSSSRSTGLPNVFRSVACDFRERSAHLDGGPGSTHSRYYVLQHDLNIGFSVAYLPACMPVEVWHDSPSGCRSLLKCLFVLQTSMTLDRECRDLKNLDLIPPVSIQIPVDPAGLYTGLPHFCSFGSQVGWVSTLRVKARPRSGCIISSRLQSLQQLVHMSLF